MSQHLGEKIIDKAPYIDLLAGPDSYRRLPAMLQALDTNQEPALDLSWDRVEHYLDIDPIREAGRTAVISACCAVLKRMPQKQVQLRIVLKTTTDVY